MSDSPSNDVKSPGEAQPPTGNIASSEGSLMSKEDPANSAPMTEEAKRAAPQAVNSFTHPLNRLGPSVPMSFGATPKDAAGSSKGASVPAPAPQPPQQPLDSLSLSQLRKLASEFPRNEPITYSFTYEDMGDFDEEIDEWFSYQVLQWIRLNQAHQHFESRWQRLVQHNKLNGQQSHDREPEDGYTNDHGASEGEEPENEITWDTADAETQENFVSALLSDLEEEEQCRSQRSEVIGCLVYIVLGRWGSSAISRDPEARSSSTARTVARPRQLDAIKSAVALITKLGGFPILWKSLREAFDPFWYVCSALRRTCRSLMETDD